MHCYFELAGLFCKKDKDCGSEDLHCAVQPDISEVSKVCIYKLSEGQTCGRSHIFSFFPLGGLTADLPCREGFKCQALRSVLVSVRTNSACFKLLNEDFNI